MRSGPVKRRRLIYRMFSRASADQTGLTKPHSRPEQARQFADVRTGQGMLEKNSESQVHVEAIEEPPTGCQHRLRAGAHRADRGSGADPVLHHSRRADHRCDFRHRAHQDRRLAEPVVPLQFQGLQAVRGGHQALPGDRIRRAGRGRRQDAAGARQSRKAPRHGHRPAAGRRRARSGLAVFGAPGAGTRQAAGGAVPLRNCRKAPPTTNSSRPSKPTRSSAASCCPKTARWR